MAVVGSQPVNKEADECAPASLAGIVYVAESDGHRIVACRVPPTLPREPAEKPARAPRKPAGGSAHEMAKMYPALARDVADAEHGQARAGAWPPPTDRSVKATFPDI